MTGRLLKRAHLRRWRTRALAAAYTEYASLGASRAALHLGPFEQPAKTRYGTGEREGELKRRQFPKWSLA